MFNGMMGMYGNYEQRKVDKHEEGGLMVSTALVIDSTKPYETAVRHPSYNGNKIVIVQEYATKKAAQKGHDKWVKKMTASKLPKQLRDVSTAAIAQLCDTVGGSTDWRDN